MCNCPRLRRGKNRDANQRLHSLEGPMPIRRVCRKGSPKAKRGDRNRGDRPSIRSQRLRESPKAKRRGHRQAEPILIRKVCRRGKPKPNGRDRPSAALANHHRALPGESPRVKRRTSPRTRGMQGRLAESRVVRGTFAVSHSTLALVPGESLPVLRFPATVGDGICWATPPGTAPTVPVHCDRTSPPPQVFGVFQKA
jgi:hypothetical protein